MSTVYYSISLILTTTLGENLLAFPSISVYIPFLRMPRAFASLLSSCEFRTTLSTNAYASYKNKIGFVEFKFRGAKNRNLVLEYVISPCPSNCATITVIRITCLSTKHVTCHLIAPTRARKYELLHPTPLYGEFPYHRWNVM